MNLTISRPDDSSFRGGGRSARERDEENPPSPSPGSSSPGSPRGKPNASTSSARQKKEHGEQSAPHMQRASARMSRTGPSALSSSRAHPGEGVPLPNYYDYKLNETEEEELQRALRVVDERKAGMFKGNRMVELKLDTAFRDHLDLMTVEEGIPALEKNKMSALATETVQSEVWASSLKRTKKNQSKGGKKGGKKKKKKKEKETGFTIGNPKRRGTEDFISRTGEPVLTALEMSAVGLAVLEAIFLFLVWGEVKDPEARFYNKFEAYLVLTNYLDEAVLALAALAALVLFVFVFVSLTLFQDQFHIPMLVFRCCAVSLPSVGICMTLVVWGSRERYFSLCTSVLSMLCVSILGFVFWWDLKVREKEKVSSYLFWSGCGVAGAAFVWVLLAAAGNENVLVTECPYSNNTAMPIFFPDLNEWHCAEWGQTSYAKRYGQGTEVTALSCNETFTSRWPNSLTSRRVSCPVCSFSASEWETEVYGCGVYSGASQVCKAAVHAGAINATAGGTFLISGHKLPVCFQRCLYSGFLSSEAYVSNNPGLHTDAFTVSSPLEPLGKLELKSWEASPSFSSAVGPWQAFTVQLSYDLGGISGSKALTIADPARSFDYSGEVVVSFCVPWDTPADEWVQRICPQGEGGMYIV